MIIEAHVRRILPIRSGSEKLEPERILLAGNLKPENYHPRRRRNDYIDETGRRIIRRRGGGRCARTPHESPEGCPTPERCHKRGGSLKSAERRSRRLVIGGGVKFSSGKRLKKISHSSEEE